MNVHALTETDDGNVVRLRPQQPRDLPGFVAPTLAPRNLRPLGELLLEDGAVSEANLLKASVMRGRQDVRLGEILLAHGWVTEAALTRALSRQWRTNAIDLAATPPDPRLIDAAGADFCLAQGLVPWRRVGGVTWIATARPEGFDALLPGLQARFGNVRMLLTSETAAQEAILATRRIALIRRAESRVDADQSCRTRNEARTGRLAVLLLAAVTAAALLAPVGLIAMLTIWATLALMAATGLKLMAFQTTWQANRNGKRVDEPPEMTAPLPVVSVMVPLFRESDVAGKLVARLARLTYPRELTDILLVVEASDDVTCNALRDAVLPRWIRVVKVPDGPIKTKPRAMNYALNFCRGQIIGVWDAEDRPDPDQLHKVVRRFDQAPDDVVCLQGALDFYNPRSNWLARCFTIEYASWFRVILPGIARMGLVVPLGGTTLFMRRAALEAVGAWDAWNVTEDADLGVRLARRGWRTEILDTTTDEEANCRAVPWVKQRSRWLKGYAMTWAVHMRQPLRLWRELGAKRFIGFQIQFFATLSLALLAPVMWSFWLLSLGMGHPLAPTLGGLLGGNATALLFTIFVLSEMIGLAVGLYAVRGRKHRHLLGWVPTMHLYGPLACFAGWKAIYEVVVKPFYWDKTAHGLFDVHAEIDSTAPAPTPLIAGSRDIPLLGQIGAPMRGAAPQVATAQSAEPTAHDASAHDATTAAAAPQDGADGTGLSKPMIQIASA